VNGLIVVIGSPGRTQAFLPAFILATLFMLPLLLRFKEQYKPIVHSTQNVYKKTREGLKKLWTTHKNIGKYLVAFSLTSDVIMTTVLYFAIAADAMYKVSDNTKFL
jgi:MFS-type transporter involved in bile tolerance (Atg22 family)